jgi:hypothetical protein
MINLTAQSPRCENVPPSTSVTFPVIPTVRTKSSKRMKAILKNHTYFGSLIAVLRAIAHPVNQDIKHETVTEQTNRE